MNTRAFPSTLSPAPQLRVRTDLRAGDPVAKCQNELEKLQKHYKELLAEAQRRGFLIP